MTPQETEPELPVSVWKSLAEVWVDSELLWGQRPWQQQSYEGWHGPNFSWRRPSLGIPQNHQVGNPQTGNNYTKEVLTLLQRF